MRQPTALHLFCGLGGGGLGFARAGFRGVGAIDCDPEAVADYTALVGEPATVADLETMTATELRAICTEPPDVLFTSPPCKAFSGCLPEATSKTDRYKAMSSLALHGVWLALEAWPKHPPRLIVLENVPRIMSRGRQWLDHLRGLLEGYGYAVTESTHDCGELGGLAQRRRRFLLVARHVESVPALLYKPPVRAHRTIGDVIGDLPVPLPGSREGGPLHRLPRLAPITWVRLALVPAGGDWRDLERIESVKVDCRRREGSMGVTAWDGVSTAIIAHGTPHNGPWQVADPRIGCSPRGGVYGVESWDGVSGTVIGNARIDTGRWAIADPRVPVVDGPAFDLADKTPTHMVIEAADGTWHRPLTTLELAALQGLPTRTADGEWLRLAGKSQRRARMRIGNAVPVQAAEAIARQMRITLADADGEGFVLAGGRPVWVERAEVAA